MGRRCREMTDAGWLPDPTGKHEYRFWDGSEWTEDVSDGGQVGRDSLAPPPPNLAVSESLTSSPSRSSAPGSDNQSQSRRRPPVVARALAVVAVVVVGAVVAVALVGSGSGESTHTIRGTMTLIDSDVGGSSGDCYGTEGYDDIEQGAQVTVKNGSGKTLAVSDLQAGSSDDEDFMVSCEFGFVVRDVPDASFYDVTVSHRGGVSFSKDEMERKNWHVRLTLGS
jgi:hypothetical protein